MAERCPVCQVEVPDYSAPNCSRCGNLIGWPNYRKALFEQPVLDARYQSARADLDGNGLTLLREQVERLAEASLPVVGMDANACSDLLKGGKYRNYHYRVEIGDRDIASEANHGNRSMVNERLYPKYGRHLQYAVLSPDGLGLTSYGPIAVAWRVDPHYLMTRATLLEENEFLFFEAHGLGSLNAVVPSGYRAIWEDRAKLVIAKLAPSLNAATALADLQTLILRPGADRWNDVFVEVVIYADGGIDSLDVASVALLEPLTDRNSQRKWREVMEACAQRGIRVVRR